MKGFKFLLEYTEGNLVLLEHTEGSNGQPGSVADDEEGDQSATHTSQVEVLGSTGEGGPHGILLNFFIHSLRLHKYKHLVQYISKMPQIPQKVP